MATRGTFVTRARARSFGIALVCALALLGLLATHAFGASPVSDLPVSPSVAVGGDVYATAHDASGNQYIGGSFGWIGQNTGTGVVVSSDVGSLMGWTLTNDTIYCSDTDGDGGTYIGGMFETAGGRPTNGLAHVLADGDVDLGFNLRVGGPVYAMLRVGDTLYVGGDFYSVSDDGGDNWVNRRNLAAFDLTTGSLMPGWVAEPPDAAVQSLAYLDGVLYVGGDFLAMGENTRPYLAALDADDGGLRGWRPWPNGSVTTLAFSDTGELYAGGRFTTMVDGEYDCAYIARFSAPDVSIAPDNWPAAEFDDRVKAISVSGTRVAVGGDFTVWGAETAAGWAVLSSPSGNLIRANENEGDTVQALRYIGDDIYVGGYTYASGPTTIRYAYRLSSLLFPDYTWNPRVSTAAIRTFCGTDGGIFIGGDLESADTTPVDNLAKIKPDGTLDDTWLPNPNNTVLSIAVADDTVYFGGHFDAWADGDTAYIAACLVEDATRAAEDLQSAPAPVYALEVAGGRVYVGTAAVDASPPLYALAPGTGAVDPTFDANVSGGAVYAFDVRDSRIYAGGSEVWNGDFYSRATAFDLDGNVDYIWSDRARPSGEVYAVCVSPDGGDVYLGGTFMQAGGYTRYNLARLNAGTGNAEDWSPDPDSGVRTIRCSGSSVYIGGYFMAIEDADWNGNSAVRQYVAEITDRGFVSGWGASADDPVWALDTSQGSLWVGGTFGGFYDAETDLILPWPALGRFVLAGSAERPYLEAPEPNGEAGWYKGPDSVDVTITPAAVDDSVFYRWDPDDDWVPYEGTAVRAPEGTSTLEAYAQSPEGFDSSITSQRFRVDTTSPTVEAVFNGGSNIVTQSALYDGLVVMSMDATATDFGSGVDDLKQGLLANLLTIDWRGKFNTSPETTVTVDDWTALTLGFDGEPVPLMFIASDAAGNVTEFMQPMFVDVVGPPSVLDAAAWIDTGGSAEVTWTPRPEVKLDHHGYVGARVIKSAYGSATSPMPSEGYEIVYQGEDTHFIDPAVDQDVIYYYTIYPYDEYWNFGDPVTVATIDPAAAGRVRTSFEQTASTDHVGYNGLVTVTGTLTAEVDPAGARVMTPRYEVALWSSVDGVHWSEVGPAELVGKGIYEASTRLVQNKYLSLRFAGDDEYQPSSTTDVIRTTAKASVGRPTAARVGTRKYRFSGTLRPAHTSSTSVVLRLSRKVNGHWWTWRTIKVAVPKNTTYYATTAKLPYGGDWCVKAWHQDASHPYSVSSVDTFGVR